MNNVVSFAGKQAIEEAGNVPARDTIKRGDIYRNLETGLPVRVLGVEVYPGFAQVRYAFTFTGQPFEATALVCDFLGKHDRTDVTPASDNAKLAATPENLPGSYMQEYVAVVSMPNGIHATDRPRIYTRKEYEIIRSREERVDGVCTLRVVASFSVPEELF